MRKVTFVLGLGIGYVLGTRSGRDRYEQMVTKAKEVADRPEVRDVAGKVSTTVAGTVATAQAKVGEKVGDKLPAAMGGHSSQNAYPTSMQDEAGMTSSPHPTA